MTEQPTKSAAIALEWPDILAVAGLGSISVGLYLAAGLPAVLIEVGAVLTVLSIATAVKNLDEAKMRNSEIAKRLDEILLTLPKNQNELIIERRYQSPNEQPKSWSAIFNARSQLEQLRADLDNKPRWKEKHANV